MIIFKQKQYVIPEEEKFVKPAPFRIPNNCDIFRMDIIESGSYKRELDSRSGPMWSEWLKDLRRARKEIKKGYIYDDNPGNLEISKTHYYPSESELGKRYYTSKNINGGDRLMYDIYAPELRTDENTGEEYIYQKVVLLHCIGHTHRNGRKFSKQE